MVTSLEFTLGLFCQTISGFPVHLAKGYLAPHHVMAAFHGEDVALPLPMVNNGQALMDCSAGKCGQILYFSRGKASFK